MKHRWKTFIKLAVCTSTAMYLLNKFIESSALIHHLLKEEGKFYPWRHGKIYYTKSGTGSPLLFIHDLNPTSSQYEWHNVINALSKSHTVYAIDLPGCGRSEKPNITYTNYFYVQMITDFIQDVIQEETTVIASGKSSSFVTMAAKQKENLFHKLYYVNPESFARTSVMPTLSSKIARAILCCPILGTTVYYFLTCQDQINYNFTEKYYYNPFLVADKTTHTYYEAAHTCRGDGRYLLASLEGNYINIQTEKAFSSLQIPVCLIFGKELPNAARISALYSQANPNVTLSFLEKTKMLPQLEAPEAFLNLID